VSGAYLTCAEVADTLGVSTRTVLRWVERGELEALRLPGGRLRIPQSAYSAWVAKRMTTANGRIIATASEEADRADG
jgi:excisionase family DNA binding protein